MEHGHVTRRQPRIVERNSVTSTDFSVMACFIHCILFLNGKTHSVFSFGNSIHSPPLQASLVNSNYDRNWQSEKVITVKTIGEDQPLVDLAMGQEYDWTGCLL